MAKKKAVKVEAVIDPAATKPIRLELTADDHAGITEVARALKLSKAAFARMAVMDRVRAEKARLKA